MTDHDVRQYLQDNGYPPHVVRGGLEGLIQRWQEFVAEVEEGYGHGLSDYRNDLDLRGVPALVGAADDPAVSSAEERLQPLLTGAGQRVWESLGGDPWWDFGYPRNAS